MTASSGSKADCRVVLIGMMGSGKSTVGRLLAKQVGWKYIDNDELLELDSGATARDLLDQHGEKGLRAAEARALGAGLATEPPWVVSAAAGSILDPRLRQQMSRGSFVVWLTASPSTLARRTRGSAHRPWLSGDAEAWMMETLAERAPIYESMAEVVISTERRRPAAVALQIADWLAERCK
jgi:shikimate kinase